jgi:hypothetical protein
MDHYSQLALFPQPRFGPHYSQLKVFQWIRDILVILSWKFYLGFGSDYSQLTVFHRILNIIFSLKFYSGFGLIISQRTAFHRIWDIWRRCHFLWDMAHTVILSWQFYSGYGSHYFSADISPLDMGLDWKLSSGYRIAFAAEFLLDIIHFFMGRGSCL